MVENLISPGAAKKMPIFEKSGSRSKFQNGVHRGSGNRRKGFSPVSLSRSRSRNFKIPVSGISWMACI